MRVPLERRRRIQAWLRENARDLAGAVSFLTTVPVPRSLAGVPSRRVTAFFPAAGYVIGGIVALTHSMTDAAPAGLRGALLLGSWLAATGMLHLDGLLDCADALLASATTERRLEILRDPRIGSFAFGVGGIHLLLKWQGLCLVGDPGLLVAVPALARLAVLLPMTLYPPARAAGLAVLAHRPRLAIPVLLALPAALAYPAAGLTVLVGALVVAAWSARRLGGGLTGDVYGAAIEVGEVAALLACTVRG